MQLCRIKNNMHEVKKT